MGPGVKKIVNHEYLCKDIQPEGDSQRAGLGDEPRAAKQRRAESVPQPPQTQPEPVPQQTSLPLQGLEERGDSWESGNHNQREQPKLKLRQPILSWPTLKPEDREGREKEQYKGMKMSEGEITKNREKPDQSKWMKGCGEEENERYRNFLRYCEERRQESKLQQEMDIERKQKAKEKERQWDMLRLSIEYLKENETKWRTRKIQECDRIREEEKIDRLAIESEEEKIRHHKAQQGRKQQTEEENRREARAIPSKGKLLEVVQRREQRR